MEPERLDLSALDPTADQLRFERTVSRIVRAAGPELSRRAAVSNPLIYLAAMARPTLAAAAIVAVLAMGAIAAIDRVMPAEEVPGTIVDALGVPAPASEWLAQGVEPTASELILAMERTP